MAHPFLCDCCRSLWSLELPFKTDYDFLKTRARPALNPHKRADPPLRRSVQQSLCGG